MDYFKNTGLDANMTLDLIKRTLAEDLAYGPDVTTLAIVPPEQQCVATVRAREHGVLAGIPLALAIAELAEGVHAETLLQDGHRIAPGEAALRLSGSTASILTLERTLLNLVSQLSGVATATRQWVDALAGTGIQVRDTRKTVPGLRALQKYAVRCGGGVNHRMGLGDAALIKDNHIAAAGSVTAALRAVQAMDIPIEVECDTVAQVAEAVAAGANLILLDNMSPEQVRESVALTTPEVRTELSGGLTLETVPAYADTGVDYVAVGALTHSSKVLDLGLDF